MVHDTHNPSNFEMLVRLIEILIWPVTVLIIVLLFRSKIKGVIHRVGSFKASSSGVEMTFAPQLDAAKKMFKQLRPDSVSKSVTTLESSERPSGTPYEQLLQIKFELEQSLTELAQEASISITGKSSLQLCAELEKSGVINHENGQLMRSLLTVIDAANAGITQAQVDEINTMYKAI
ncbi:hypothetical protein J1N09_06045 [Aureitalea sp. L0-47]|uniref:hypothetical protein n=1 Tax=Aureitalea sp. L0-47 TaxID=2816962 RepID=UPI002238D681|nr:hypothetical protein [Aureitalea sp. L0-47]MCW5519390.1 hypothetical protein [Aureitalea sp. L0-47]